jgi:AcrR family transcriptional regulator
MPRSSRADAQRTRDAIIREAVDDASRNGLEAITIGVLAGRLEMSKAGVIGPFGSKEALQLAALEAALLVFREVVWDPVAAVAPGRARLEAVIERWVGCYLEADVFPGGCFLTQAAADFDGRTGPVRDAIERASRRWDKVLANEVRTAIEQGELEDSDPAQVAFELVALAQGINQARQLRHDPDAGARGRAAMYRALRAVAA